MALDLNSFKTALSTAFKEAAALNDKDNVAKDKALENIGEKLAVAIDAYIRTAEVTVTALTGEVQVQGTAAAQANGSPLVFKGGDGTHSGGLS